MKDITTNELSTVTGGKTSASVYIRASVEGGKASGQRRAAARAAQPTLNPTRAKAVPKKRRDAVQRSGRSEGSLHGLPGERLSRRVLFLSSRGALE